MYLFLAFLLVPIIEIALFIQVGGLIGLWPTLAIVVLTAVMGTILVRTQGRMALANLQRSFAELDDPTEPLAHGAMILLSGVLLLTPGFFTDAVGFALLVPTVRLSVFRYLRSKVTITQFQMGPGPQSRPGSSGSDQGDVIDGEFTEVRPRQESLKPSKWVEGPHRH
ncbi:FxsA family protein [Ruegeria profundi]|uniref:FxsA family protein n=1 Tax=Ruegeria profundi TaxID=1685378 RepID=UPI001CD33DAB|nr:FxsA family protein [Ruegeria profundi]MCA0929672.1 FxsA family protein [Ruegeria profundi]